MLGTTPSIHKDFVVTNIKAHVPLILNLERHNYNICREFLTTHCETYDTLGHIDTTVDAPNPPSTDLHEWKTVDIVVRDPPPPFAL